MTSYIRFINPAAQVTIIMCSAVIKKIIIKNYKKIFRVFVQPDSRSYTVPK